MCQSHRYVELYLYLIVPSTLHHLRYGRGVVLLKTQIPHTFANAFGMHLWNRPNEISTISPFPCFFHLFTNFRFERLSILSIPVQAENADLFIWFICTFLWFFSTLCWTHPGWVFAVRVLELTSLPDKQRETEFSFSLHISQSHTIEGYEILSKHVKWHFAGGSHEMYMHWCVCVLCIVKSPW